MRDEGVVARAFDAVFGFLMRPRVRRLRRWSFLLTVPAAVFVARTFGLDLSLGTGLKAGIAAALLETALLLSLLLLGVRLVGRERRDILLDFLMHPKVRRAVALEARTLLVLPRVLWRRVRPPQWPEFAYHRGTNELGFTLAILPAIVAEGAAVHLLLHGAPTWIRLVVGAFHIYGLLMLLGLALGPRVHPHRVTNRALQLRSGHLTRADVALEAVVAVRAERRRVSGRTGLMLQNGEALLLSNGRVDVRVELREPVLLARALRDPVGVSALLVAVDDPQGLAAAVQRAQMLSAAERTDRPALLGWLAPGDLLEAATS